MFEIDHHVQWFVDPTFHSICRSGNTGTKTSQQIGIIRNIHKPIFEIYKFHGLLTLILFTQNFDIYPFLGIDTSLHMSKHMDRT